VQRPQAKSGETLISVPSNLISKQDKTKKPHIIHTKTFLYKNRRKKYSEIGFVGNALIKHTEQSTKKRLTFRQNVDKRNIKTENLD